MIVKFILIWQKGGFNVEKAYAIARFLIINFSENVVRIEYSTRIINVPFLTVVSGRVSVLILWIFYFLIDLFCVLVVMKNLLAPIP